MENVQFSLTCSPQLRLYYLIFEGQRQVVISCAISIGYDRRESRETCAPTSSGVRVGDTFLQRGAGMESGRKGPVKKF